MYSEDIHLREWGELADEYLGPAFIRFFEEGDILYGSRRTYLKKVVVAPFEGITANTTFVIKAKESKIDNRLLPFVMLSDGFTEHSIRNSKGSVNPYINWKDIADYEFLLPPKEQQAQLAKLLWAMDEVIEKEREVLERIDKFFQSEVYSSCVVNKGSKQKLSTIIDKLEAGVSVNSEEGSVNQDDFGVLKTSAVSEGTFIPTETKKVLSSEVVRLKTPVKKDSILISRMNTVELVGANAYVDNDYPNLFLPDRLWQTHISRNDVNVKFLWYNLSSPTYRAKISELCSGTSNSMKNISKQSLLNIEVNLPKIEEQNIIVKRIEKIEDSKNYCKYRIASSRVLQKSLINQIF